MKKHLKSKTDRLRTLYIILLRQIFGWTKLKISNVLERKFAFIQTILITLKSNAIKTNYNVWYYIYIYIYYDSLIIFEQIWLTPNRLSCLEVSQQYQMELVSVCSDAGGRVSPIQTNFQEQCWSCYVSIFNKIVHAIFFSEFSSFVILVIILAVLQWSFQIYCKIFFRNMSG